MNIKQFIFVSLFSILLSGCAAYSPEVSHESETWTWVFTNGTAIEFPASWRYIEFNGFSEGGYMYDAYGAFYMVRDGRTHETARRFFIEEHEIVTEIETDHIVHFLRAETTRELFPDRYYGTTEFIDYLVLAPNDAVFYARLPVTDAIVEREVAFRDVLETAYVPHDDLNTLGFLGGIAIMVYPSDWNIVEWIFIGAPHLQNDELRLTIIPYDEDYWIRTISNDENGISEVTYEDIVLENLRLNNQFDPQITYIDRLAHQIATFKSENDTFYAYIFRLNSGLWFNISFSRIDREPIQPEDEVIVMQMIDSILLNNRGSYYEPIELILPD